MKTLDEVIYQLENCAYAPLTEEALHYLKMYRSDQIEWDANRKAWDLVEEDLISARMKHIARLKELDIGTLNEPLDWDELRTMEGKPVWVECKYFHSQWAIITGVYDCKISFIGDRLLDSELKEDQGDVWKAYRKER